MLAQQVLEEDPFRAPCSPSGVKRGGLIEILWFDGQGMPVQQAAGEGPFYMGRQHYRVCLADLGPGVYVASENRLTQELAVRRARCRRRGGEQAAAIYSLTETANSMRSIPRIICARCWNALRNIWSDGSMNCIEAMARSQVPEVLPLSLRG
jgi:hypothetical protein